MKSRTRNRKKLRLCQTTSLLLILSFLIAVIPTLPLFAETADTDEITIVREEADRRTANEKHYLCSDGSIMAVAFAGDVHYRDENGVYQAIDNTLQYNAAKGQYRSAGNPNFSASFASSANRPAVLLNNGKGNHLSFITSVSLQPSSAAAAKALQLESAALSVRNESKINVKGKLKNSAEALRVPELHSEIDYQNAFGSGVSAQYALDSTSLKENVVFDYPTSYTAIVTRYAMDGLTVEVTESGALVLYDGAGEAVYAVSAPYMYDAAGAECPSVAVNAVQTDEGWTVTYVPDAAWRNSAERVYPVVFDPTTTTVSGTTMEDSHNQFFNGVFSKNVVTGSLCAGVSYVNASNSYAYEMYLKPTFPTIPAGNTATQAEIVLTKHIVRGSGTLRLHPITSGSFPLNSHEYGSWVAMTQYDAGTTQQTYSFVISAANLPEDGVENGFVVKEINGTGNSHYLQVYSSRATTVANRPKTVVTYVPMGISGKATTLQNPESAHYLTASSSTAVSATAAATPKSLWKFLSADAGCFRIQSQYHSGKCLGMNSDGNLALCATPTTTTDRNLLWIVTVYNGIYTIQNAANTNKKLYISPDENGGYSAGVGEESVSYTEWQMPDLAPGVDGIQTSLANPEAGGFLVPTTADTVGVVQGITEDVQWRFVQNPLQSFQIVPVDNPGKCLANVAGDVELVTVSSSFAETTQFWYLTESQGGYIIENVANHSKLSISNHNGTLSCTLTGMEQVWTFMDYDIPYEVFALKNTDLCLTDENSRIDLYLKNMTGKNYNPITIHPTDPTKNQYNYDVIFGLGADNRINAMNYLATTSLNDNKNSPEKAEAIGDMCGFRLKYESSDNAYRLMPLSSGNGHQRALTVPAISLNAADQSENGIDSMVMYKCTDTYKPRQLFLLEMQVNGQFVIKLKSSPSLVLTASMEDGKTTGNVTMNLRSSTLIKQTWIIEEYMAYLPKNNSTDTEYPKVSYKLLEEYYASKGFLSPLGDFELTVTSDYGQRNPGDGSVVHKGIDLRTRTETSSTDYRRDLIAPIGGTVVGVNTTDRNADSGLFIKIDTGISAYEGSEYTICIIYMHMDSVSVTSGRVIAGQKVGVSGDTGAGSAHLHYGVFLRKSGESYSANSNPLNPLLFMEPEYYVNGEFVRLPQA